ncbi:MAG: alpha/beta hydrolase, partial [bacterium]
KPDYTNLSRFLAGTFLLLLIFLTGLLNSQEVISVDNIDEDDPHVYVITNRALIESDENRLVFSSSPSKDQKHHYFIAQPKDEQWIYQSCPSLKDLLSIETEYQDLLVFVHGDGKTLQAATVRALEIQELYHVNVLVYAWPSRDMELGAIKNFKTSYQNVETSTAMMYDFLSSLESVIHESDLLADHKVTLFYHSLGNYYLEKMVEDGYTNLLADSFADNLVVNAAAVEQAGHHIWLEQIHFADRIIVNSNDDDISLSGLRVLTKLGRQLGESAEKPLASNAIYLDFTDVVGFQGMGPSHSYYFSKKIMKIKEVKDYYMTIFHGEGPPQEMDPILLSHAEGAAKDN